MKKVWSSKGTVTHINEDDEICLEVFETKVPKHIEENYTIEMVWNSVSYKRMLTGLKRFVDDE